ncbi:MAG TPA: cbb3-type cytochrome c oxidase N-terminal domain-containing protein [Sediminibacterium sp.]|nr:cbb3-type cytochrome c oxidase N-terminal domain-containing protein [Sediminibacterium sp.]
MTLTLKPYQQLLKRKVIYLLALLLSVCTGGSLSAQAADAAAAAEPAKAPEVFYDSIFAYTLLGVTVLLAAVIYVLGNVFIMAIRNKIAEQKKNGTFAKVAILILSLTAASNSLMAQAAAPAAAPANTVVSETIMYIIGSVLVLELIVIFYFTFGIRNFLRKEAAITVDAVTGKAVVKEKIYWFDRLYKRNTQEDIIKLDLGHDYDGIKELDNSVPAWWQWAFAFTVVFGMIYIYNYHIAGTKPLQQKELQIAMDIAAAKQAAYLEKSANNVDEKTVKMLGEADIAAGKALFTKPGACATCHAENGSAIVNGAPGIGPNLTDDYWLHKGDIGSVFYSIKYGWPEKGMKSWKDDYSPMQIAQLASYVKSLKGTNPTPAKEKQGELFTENGATPVPAADSAAAKTK